MSIYAAYILAIALYLLFLVIYIFMVFGTSAINANLRLQLAELLRAPACCIPIALSLYFKRPLKGTIVLFILIQVIGMTALTIALDWKFQWDYLKMRTATKCWLFYKTNAIPLAFYVACLVCSYMYKVIMK